MNPIVNQCIQKIVDADFESKPFKHLYIEDFLPPEIFQEFIKSDLIRLPKARDSRALCETLSRSGYRSIGFPGCTTDVSEYLAWERDGFHSNVNTCEGFGLVYRLEKFDKATKKLNDLLASDDFLSALLEKFNIIKEDVDYDFGIQKYLNGYEISPHPDVRAKALTYMVNVNTSPEMSKENIHTHYLTFKKEWKHVETYWENNNDVDRCWVPWSWCETNKLQYVNNSIVIFQPTSSSMHAVKASYTHFEHQRTQLYGNLWYKGYRDGGYTAESGSKNSAIRLQQPSWECYDVTKHSTGKMKSSSSLKSKIMKKIKSKFEKFN